MKNAASQKTIHRPVITTPERRCMCGAPYRYAWSWAVLLPALQIVDMCARCTRRIRYGSEQERRAVAEAIAARYGARRAA